MSYSKYEDNHNNKSLLYTLDNNYMVYVHKCSI